MKDYIVLPNGDYVEVMPAKLIDDLLQLGKLEIMTNNFVLEDGVHSLYLSKNTGYVYGLQTSMIASEEVVEGGTLSLPGGNEMFGDINFQEANSEYAEGIYDKRKFIIHAEETDEDGNTAYGIVQGNFTDQERLFILTQWEIYQ